MSPVHDAGSPSVAGASASVEPHLLAVPPHSADLIAPHGVDRLTQELGYVKAIEHVDGVCTSTTHDGEEGAPHVARHEDDLLGALLAEHVEEALEAGSGAGLCDVEQAASAVVELVDESEVLVAFF